MQELINDDYVSSSLGMKMVMVKPEGLKYLTRLEMEENPQPAINFNVGNNSNVQFQHGTVGSSQKMEVNEFRNEQLTELVNEIRKSTDLLKQHIGSEGVKDLIAETDYLERTIKRQPENKSTIKMLTYNIVDIFKNVPSNIIANEITPYLPVLGQLLTQFLG
jgi:hypothetical protein